MSEPTSTKLELSWGSILRVLGTLIGLWFLWQVQDILVILFLVFIFVATLNPVVTRWQKTMPRILAVTLIYLIFVAVVVASGTLFFQPLIEQINTLAHLIPAKVNNLIPLFQRVTDGQSVVQQLTQSLQQFSGSLANFSGSVITTTFGIFGGLFTVFTILVLTFYLLLEEKAARDFLSNLLPPVQREYAFTLINKITVKMGSWMRGQLLLMLIVGILDYIVLVVMKVPAPLALAMWGGLMEIIPFIGPALGAIPAVIVAFATGSALHALVVALLLLLLIQQLEGHIIVPKVMEKAVGISPVSVILALLVGGKIYGFTGALLAVPIAAIIAVLVQDWPTVEKAFNKKSS